MANLWKREVRAEERERANACGGKRRQTGWALEVRTKDDGNYCNRSGRLAQFMLNIYISKFTHSNMLLIRSNPSFTQMVLSIIFFSGVLEYSRIELIPRRFSEKNYASSPDSSTRLQRTARHWTSVLQPRIDHEIDKIEAHCASSTGTHILLFVVVLTYLQLLLQVTNPQLLSTMTDLKTMRHTFELLLVEKTRCEYIEIRTRRQRIRLVEHSGQEVNPCKPRDSKDGPGLKKNRQRHRNIHSAKQAAPQKSVQRAHEVNCHGNHQSLPGTVDEQEARS